MKDRIFWLILIFACLYILGNIGTGSLTTWDEAVYANISKEVFVTNSWLVLHDQGNPWFEKPPLYMWLTALFYRLFGVAEFSTRLASGLLGVATVLLLYVFVKQMCGQNAAILSSLFLLAMPHYLHFAKMGMLDVSLTFFLLLMAYLFWKGQERPIFLFFSGAVFCLAYLTKGFAAFLGPAIIVLFAVFSGNARLLFKRHFVFGVILSLGVIASWHYAQYQAAGRQAIDSYFGYHVFSRATSSLEGHVGGPNFYQKAVFNKSKPWAAVPYLAFLYMIWLALGKRDKRAILACTWIMATYALFTVIKTKLHWYIIPIYPALAISAGMLLERLFKKRAFNICLGAVLILMVAQANYSWAFKLDFSPQLKKAAAQARALQGQGIKVFVYPTDASDIFYCGFAERLTPDFYAAIRNNEGAALLAPPNEIVSLASKYGFNYRLVYASDKLSLFKIRPFGRAN